jgi:hypothetical protein
VSAQTVHGAHGPSARTAGPCETPSDGGRVFGLKMRKPPVNAADDYRLVNDRTRDGRTASVRGAPDDP